MRPFEQKRNEVPISHPLVGDRGFVASQRSLDGSGFGSAQSAPPQSTAAESDLARPLLFDDFYQEEFAAMVSLARSICGNHAHAEEIAQEAFTKAHQAWSEVSGYDQPGAWIRRVTVNQAISQRRRATSERNVLRRVRPQRSWAPADDQFDGDPDLWRAIGELSPRQRAAIALFYGEDRTTREIAEIFDCTISTATTHLDQARKRLAKMLNETNPAGDQ